jgi:O-antigen/teichoic acid export membrane protein
MNILFPKLLFLKSKFINDSLWSLLGNTVSKGLGLAAGIIVARLLGKEIFGEFSIVRNTIMTITMFSTFGLGYTVTKFIAEYKTNKPRYLKLILKYATNITLVFSGTMAVILMLSAEFIANQFFLSHQLSIPLRILAALIVVNALTTLQIGVLNGFGKFKETARINSIVGVVTFISSSILTYAYGLNGALTALLLTQIINYILNYRLTRKSLPDNVDQVKKSDQLYKEILSFSIPIALQEAIYSIIQWVSNLLLIKFASIGELGLYTAAMHWNAIILFNSSILMNVVLAHLSGANKDQVKHSKIMKSILWINLAVTLLPAIIVMLTSQFISEAYGQSFHGLDRLISIAAFTAVFASVSNVYAQAYMSKGLNWEMLLFRVIRDMGIIIAFILILNNGSVNAAASLIYSGLFMNIIFLIIMAAFYQRQNTKNLSSTMEPL